MEVLGNRTRGNRVNWQQGKFPPDTRKDLSQGEGGVQPWKYSTLGWSSPELPSLC